MFNFLKKGKDLNTNDLDLPPLPPLENIDGTSSQSSEMPDFENNQSNLQSEFPADIPDFKTPNLDTNSNFGPDGARHDIDLPPISNDNISSLVKTDSEDLKAPTLDNQTMQNSNSGVSDGFDLKAPALEDSDDSEPVLQNDVAKQPAQLSPDGVKEPDAISKTQTYDYSFPEIEELESEVQSEKVHFDEILEQSHSQTKFVDLEDFQAMLEDLNQIKIMLNEKKDVYVHLNDIKNMKDEKFLKWKNKLEDIQRKLVFIDKNLFGDN